MYTRSLTPPARELARQGRGCSYLARAEGADFPEGVGRVVGKPDRLLLRASANDSDQAASAGRGNAALHPRRDSLGTGRES